jgi:hypothetical protein
MALSNFGDPTIATSRECFRGSSDGSSCSEAMRPSTVICPHCVSQFSRTGDLRADIDLLSRPMGRWRGCHWPSMASATPSAR